MNRQGSIPTRNQGWTKVWSYSPAIYSIISQDRYGCFDHHHRGTCTNNRSIKRQIVEERLLSGLRDKLIDPEIVREMIREMQAEANRKDRERRLIHA